MSNSQPGRGGRSTQQPDCAPDDFDREAIIKEIYEGILTCSDEKAELYQRVHQSNYNRLSVMSVRYLRKDMRLRYENLFRSEIVLAALKERERILQSSLETAQNHAEETSSNKGDRKEATDPSTTTKRKKKKKKRKSVQVQTEKASACPTIQTKGESSSNNHKGNQHSSISHLVTTDVILEIINSKLKEIPTNEGLPLIKRSIKVLIRGIPADTNTEEIVLELEKKGLKIHKIIQFSKRADDSYRPLPVFLAILPELSDYKKICTIKFYKEYPIDVEKFRKSRELLQCFRCQGFHHCPRTCTSLPRCMKCAGEHFSYECTNSRDTPAKCCNCGQNHTSNFSGCKARPRRNEGKSNPASKNDRIRRIMNTLIAF